LADGKAKRALSAFSDQLFGMKHLEEATKDPAVFPLWTDSLKASMRRELELRVEDMVFTRKGDFLSLFDDRSTFVNAELAKFYGLPAVAGDGFLPATFPADSPRAGLLGAGAVLAGHALPQRTSPTQRGKFVAESLLCRAVPPPPPNVPPLPPMAGPDATLRERLEMHRAAPQCASCHAIMDPMGFGMENFDSIGLPRTMDGTKPVDATGTLTGPGLARPSTRCRRASAVAKIGSISCCWRWSRATLSVSWNRARAERSHGKQALFSPSSHVLARHPRGWCLDCGAPAAAGRYAQ
jgi:hypothetical protein